MRSQDNAISSIPFFKNLTSEDLIALMSYTKTMWIEEEDLLFSQGDHPDGLFVLLSGKLNVYVRSGGNGARRPVATIKPGQYVGEFGLVDGEPRSAYVQAGMRSEVLSLPSKAFELLIRIRPRLAESVVQRLCDIIVEQSSISLHPDFRVRVQARDFEPTSESMKLLCGVLRKHNATVQTRGY